MNIEEILDHCLGKPDTFECFPFDEDTLVFKVGTPEVNRMFAFVSLEKGNSITLKCEPGRAVDLRERHPEIEPAYHMNKRHWNSVYIEGGLADPQIRELIDHSYELTRKALPRYIREMLDK